MVTPSHPGLQAFGSRAGVDHGGECGLGSVGFRHHSVHQVWPVRGPCQVLGLESEVQGLGFSVEGCDLRVEGLKFRV